MRAPTVETGLAPSPRVPPNRSATKNNRSRRRALLRWYDLHRRDLPWRKTRDPYRIWLSEIMLQQTRVAAVLDHYRIFLDRFPNLDALAAASEDAVLAAWSGLGYYRRARMLRRCAQQIVENHGGQLPQNSTTLVSLPGIGRYTAAAIASIAFAEPIAVVDGNVERVLERFTGVDLTASQTWREAQALLDPSRPGDFNQAMMELGATVCLPHQPRCPSCPLRKWCLTRSCTQPGGSTTLPLRAAPPTHPRRKKTIWCDLSESTRGVRLIQRPAKTSVMPGMWELPTAASPPATQPPPVPWRTFRHSITVTGYTVHVSRNGRTNPKGRWIEWDRIPHLAITGLTRKILKAASIL